MRVRNWIYAILLIVSVSMVMSSCYRDDLDAMGTVYVEGRPTALRLRIGTPSMNVATRSDMPAGKDSDLNSLWIGIFSARTGECTFAELYENFSELSSSHGDFAELTIEAVSGNSYIVAVGNPVNNNGYQYNSSSSTSARLMELSNILPRTTAAANPESGTKFTWESYKNVAIRQLEMNDINTPIGNLVMSGIYIDSTDDPSDWEEKLDNMVYIPASDKAVELEGAIHLRRLISQVKFTIQAAPYTGSEENKRSENDDVTIIEVIPYSYRVINVPYTSWLHERPSPGKNDSVETKLAKGEKANSGDIIRVQGLSYNGELPQKLNYRSSVLFNGSQYITEVKKKDDNGISTAETDYYEFDFWLLENKRRAVKSISSNQYDLREKEIKEEQNEFGYTHNTGIYTALCGDEGIETMNNCAAVVELQCRVIYTTEGYDAIHKEERYEEVQYRSADVVYMVHLGGMHNDWEDFIHRRNHKYTYNIKVMDIQTIIVEGRQEGDETRPGIEGVVTDVINPPFEMDAHYGMVNIQLSNRERKGIIWNPDEGRYDDSNYDHFQFRIRIYDENGEVQFIDQNNYLKFDPKYWQWIELRALSEDDLDADGNPLKVADYKPYNYAFRENEPRTFRLNEIADLVKFPGTNGSTDEREDIQQWYTLFVDEYVYEDYENGDGNELDNAWVTYVNKPPRMCWLNTFVKSSVDEESHYINSKYVVRQQSIQTFYTIPDGHRGDERKINAIGMEHVNESFGFNLRWDGIPTDYSSYKDGVSHQIRNNNGRHNTLLYIFGTPINSNDYPNRSRGTNWSDYLDFTRLQYIDGINTSSNQYDRIPQLEDAAYRPKDDPNREPYYVPSLKTYTNGNSLGYSDINTTYFLRILDACMNRNRDNNGNGIIDPEEVRWYVPASSEIVDIILGRNSVDTPLLDYGENTALNSPRNYVTTQSHQANTRFHYATSNLRTLWAEEGTTINPHIDWHDGWNLPPLNVRCVRALGTDLATDENADLTPAFTTDADDGGYPTKIFPTYYEQKNQRSYSPEVISAHQETSTLNRLSYNGFEFSPQLYSFDVYTANVKVGEVREVEWDDYELSKDKAGWYLPDLSTRATVEFTGSMELPELWKNGIPSHPSAEAYMPDITTYRANIDDLSDDEKSAFLYYDTEFWGGGTYYKGDNYTPDLSSKQDYEDGDHIRFTTNNGVSEGWYKPDLSVGNNWVNGGGTQNFWSGFFIGRVKCKPGYYLPDLTFDVKGSNYWPEADNGYFCQTKISQGLEAYQGTLLREAGFYAPDLEAGLQDPNTEGAAYWDEVWVGVGDPRITVTPIYEDVTVGNKWTGPSGGPSQNNLFIIPNNGGDVDISTFVKQHGVTLEAANYKCQKELGRNWRIPNMKEAALIKIAMEHAGIYKENGLTWEKYLHHNQNTDRGTEPYEVGNFLCCTFREFGVDGSESRADVTGYYSGVYYPESDAEQQAGDWYDDYNGRLMGRVSCITSGWYRHYYIRCVRDLETPEDPNIE